MHNAKPVVVAELHWKGILSVEKKMCPLERTTIHVLKLAHPLGFRDVTIECKDLTLADTQACVKAVICGKVANIISFPPTNLTPKTHA